MMIVHLILALVAFAFIIYTFVYSPLAIRIGDVIFYEPLEEGIRRFEAAEWRVLRRRIVIMKKTLIEHWRHRKSTLCVTLVTGALMAMPAFWLTAIGPQLYVIMFPFYFLVALVLWHEAKDRVYYWWRKRK